ncbi:TlpA family protein disulfide reductase [Mucilaginibacter polytrichastri]|nr:TlpA disulfide reductase family protein [Mucilaginibacter polytrichastri]SFS75414.1 Thiol-disulfide isomerase or thioredoxin [Mucilaginibacter polytrichastri]
MKKYLSFVIYIVLFTRQAYAVNTNPEAIKTLMATADKLLAMQSINYHYTRETNYYKDNYFSNISADSYMEFDGEKVSRFQLNSETSKQIYNGTVYFALNKKDHTYALTTHVDQKIFSSFSYFNNSIPSFRFMLKYIIQNDSIGKTQHDTTLAGNPYKVVGLTMQNKVIDYLGGYMKFTKQVTIYYDLIIDAATSLPYQIIQRNNIEKADFVRVTYTNINTSPVKPAELTWYYSTYTKDYKPEKKAAIKPIITVGTTLAAWQLPEYKNNDIAMLQSSSLKGKVVFMEFWIKNCGPCMEMFPVLKSLQQKFNNQAVQILTVNAYDSSKDVGFFYYREKPAYKMLYAGEALAKEVGIAFYPQAILLDKSGKVIYAGAFGAGSKAKIEQLIEKIL